MPYERILGNNFRGQDPGLTSPPHVRDFGINGPYHISGVSETPSRAKIFICRPDAAGDDEVRCAKKIVTALARQAYRQPPTDTAVEELMTAFQRGRNRGRFRQGRAPGNPDHVGAPFLCAAF